MINNTLLITIAGVVLAVAAGLYFGTQWEASASGQYLAVQSLVLDFGTQFKNVSLFSPDAAQQIEKVYGNFVTPALLSVWMQDPNQAPGRFTASPWPDHLVITAMTKQQIDYEVDADIVLMTDGGVAGPSIAGIIPAHFIVSPQAGGTWLISRYQSP